MKTETNKARGRMVARPFKGTMSDFVKTVLVGLPVNFLREVAKRGLYNEIILVEGQKTRVPLDKDEIDLKVMDHIVNAYPGMTDQTYQDMLKKLPDTPAFKQKYDELSHEEVMTGHITFQELVKQLKHDEKGFVVDVEENEMTDIQFEMKNVDVIKGQLNGAHEKYLEIVKSVILNNVLAMPEREK